MIIGTAADDEGGDGDDGNGVGDDGEFGGVGGTSARSTQYRLTGDPRPVILR